MVLLNSAAGSRTGSASMSPRSSTAGAGPLPVPVAEAVPRSTAVTDVQDVPAEISSGRPLSAPRTACCVSGSCSPISGLRCS